MNSEEIKSLIEVFKKSGFASSALALESLLAANVNYYGKRK